MPAREAVAPGGVPVHDVVGEAAHSLEPQGKVRGVLFLRVLVHLVPNRRQLVLKVLPGQLEATFGGGEANVCASVAMLLINCFALRVSSIALMLIAGAVSLALFLATNKTGRRAAEK